MGLPKGGECTNSHDERVYVPNGPQAVWVPLRTLNVHSESRNVRLLYTMELARIIEMVPIN
jgi:hypothetical protein